MEWNAQPDVLQWVGGILDEPAYANHHVIMAPHAYIDAFGSLDNPRWGAQLADFIAALTKLIDEHSSNVFLTLNGHFCHGVRIQHPPTDKQPEPADVRQAGLRGRAGTTQTGRGVDNPPAERHGQGRRGDGHRPHVRHAKQPESEPGSYDVYPGKWRTQSTEQYAVVMFPDVVQKLKAIAQ